MHEVVCACAGEREGEKERETTYIYLAYFFSPLLIVISHLSYLGECDFLNLMIFSDHLHIIIIIVNVKLLNNIRVQKNHLV